MRKTDLERFLEESLYHEVAATCVKLKDFLKDFRDWMVTTNRNPKPWTRERIAKELKGRFPIGPGPGNHTVIGNMTDKPIMEIKYILTEEGTVRLTR